METVNKKRPAIDNEDDDAVKKEDTEEISVTITNKNKKKKHDLKGAVTEYNAALLVGTSSTTTISYSNEYVSSKFMLAYPEYNSEKTESWMPANKIVGEKTRL